MSPPLSAQLKQLTEACTVEIPRAGINGGSGFFIAPGVVVSCAHVVAQGNGPVLEQPVTVKWREELLYGQVRAVPPNSDNSQIWPFPDLCVIELDTAPIAQPWVLLDDSLAADSPELYVAGYGSIYDSPEVPQFHGKRARLDGPYDALGGRFWQVADCEITAGMSGAPVLDLGSAAVCAVAKTQRLPDSPAGGLVTPVSAIRASFPLFWARSQREAQQLGRWRAIRRAIREMSNRLEATLTRRELETLRQAGDLLGLRRPQLNRLWHDIVGDGALPSTPFRDVLDLAAALADRLVGSLDPLSRLFAMLASWEESPLSSILVGYAREIATRNGQTSEFEEYQQADHKNTPPPVPVIVIRVDRNEPDLRELSFTAWCYPDQAAPVTWIGQGGPYTKKGLAQAVAELLTEQIPRLPGVEKPLIEVALPDDLLDHAVEDWLIDGVRLGIRYPLVVRFAHLSDGDARESAATAARFRGSRLPHPEDEDAWADLWLSCVNRPSRNELVGLFGLRDRLPLLAMTAWHQGERPPLAVESDQKAGVWLPLLAMTAWHQGKRLPPLAVESAQKAGVWIILWRHRPCLGDQFNRDATTPCQCKLFQQAVVDHFSDCVLDDLPKDVWELRKKIVAGKVEKTADRIAILWDDPGRAKWRTPRQARNPVEETG